MDNLNKEIKNKILEILKVSKIGASASQISKKIGHNRVTVSKYLEVMKAHEIIDYEGIAQAKLWYIKKDNSKPTLLIVDDEKHIVELVALSLVPEKFRIIKAYTGLDALDLVYKENPDLIVLDLMMPGINGFEVCKKIKENPLLKKIPIIMLSAKGEIDDKLQGLKIGADDYMTKPFDPMELEARVERILRSSVQNQDTHPLTKLPGITSVTDYLQKSLLNSSDFTIYNYNIKNFSDYNKMYGIKKGNHLLSMLSRIFSDSMKGNENFFIGHTINDHFVIISSYDDFNVKINKSFKTILPYIYDKKKLKKDLELQFKKLEIKNNKKGKLNPNQILTKLGVNS
jgi:CheY-like chemotaxis protein